MVRENCLIGDSTTARRLTERPQCILQGLFQYYPNVKKLLNHESENWRGPVAGVRVCGGPLFLPTRRAGRNACQFLSIDLPFEILFENSSSRTSDTAPARPSLIEYVFLHPAFKHSTSNRLLMTLELRSTLSSPPLHFVHVSMCHPPSC